jgi:hypothetical protein
MYQQKEDPTFRLCLLPTKEALRAISAVIFITFISLTVSAQQYRIKLDRLENAGDKYHLTATSNETTTADATVSGQALQKGVDVQYVEISANITILQAAMNHWATRKRFVILSSALTQAGRTGPILPNGTEVTAAIENGETVYQVNQKPLTPEVTKALRSVISLHISSVADDDMFGTATPKRVGESWMISVEAMKKLLKEINVQGGRQEITGSGTLERVAANHAFVRSSIHVRDVLLPIVPELKPESGEIELELSGRFPVKHGDMTVESQSTIHMSRVGSGVSPDGKKVILHVTYERKSRYEIRPPKEKLSRPKRKIV